MIFPLPSLPDETKQPRGDGKIMKHQWKTDDARWQAIRDGFAELPAIGKALADLCRAFRTPPPKPAAVVLPGQHGTEER